MTYIIHNFKSILHIYLHKHFKVQHFSNYMFTNHSLQNYNIKGHIDTFKQKLIEKLNTAYKIYIYYLKYHNFETMKEYINIVFFFFNV